jgi:hypothetical protein
MLSSPHDWPHVAGEILRIASQPAEWVAAASLVPTITTTHRAALALVATFMAGSAVTGMALVTVQGLLSAPGQIEAVAAAQERQTNEMEQLERRLTSRMLESESRMDLWESRFAQLRCEIIEALQGQLPRDCDQRILRP